jgi:hypothetical protein
MFPDCDLCLNFFCNSTSFRELAIAESDLEWSGFWNEETSNVAFRLPDIDETSRCTRINHCVGVDPIPSRPDLDFDDDM